MKTDLFAETIINLDNYPSISCGELYDIVEFLHKKSIFDCGAAGDIYRSLALRLEQDIVEEDVYIYRNYVREKVRYQNEKARLKML
jgi:hypothetical protein